MDTLTPRVLRRLAAIEEPHCIVLMPTHRAGRDNEQDAIRLKNLMGQAEDRLRQAGIPNGRAREAIAPLQRLMEEQDFWVHQSDGLALYLTSGGMRRFCLPQRLPEKLVVGSRLHLSPLLPLLEHDARYFVLAVSGDRVQLLECTRHTLEEREVPDMPQTLDDITSQYEEDRHVTFHTETSPHQRPGPRGGGMIYTAQGAGSDLAKRTQRWSEFCQRIDAAICRELANESAPLVVVADEQMWGHYQKFSHYKNLVGTPVKVSPAMMKESEMRDQAWQLIAPQVHQRRQATRDLFGEAKAHGRGADRLDDILPALHDGRVATLLIQQGTEVWGRYDTAARRTELHREPGRESEELLNLAALRAILTDAQVLSFPREEMPDQQPLAAIYRW